MQYMTDYSFVEPSVQDALTAWATKVRTAVNVYAALNNIHRNLMGSGGVRGAVGACGQAFYTAWRVAKSIPLDDRAYYNPIITYLSDKIIYQAQGVRWVWKFSMGEGTTEWKRILLHKLLDPFQYTPVFFLRWTHSMIQDAYLILAMDAVRNRAKALNQDIVVGAFAERSNICNIIIAAYNQNPASALAAGRSLCIDRSDFSAKIHNNIVQQIEYMGMPFSNGDAGQGVRLLLGSDITMTNAVLVNNADDPKNQVGGRGESSATEDVHGR